MLKVYMCGGTLICQKLGSEDSSARLYWSSCRRSRSNNLKNTTCAALASQQINRMCPYLAWKRLSVKAPNTVGAELQLLCGWGGARHAAPLCGTPQLSLTTVSAPPLLFTPAGANLPSEPAGTWIQCLKGNGEGGGGAGGGCRGKRHSELS